MGGRKDPDKSVFAQCPFCPLGKPEERAVIHEREQRAPPIGFEHHGARYEDRFYCGLGAVGRECVIPKIVTLSYNGDALAREVADSNPRIG